MSELTHDVREYARQIGADVVGVADIRRFDGAPEEFHPCSLIPGAKSVVVMAVRILGGVQIPQNDLVQNYQYQIFGYGWLSHIRLNMLGFEVARYLEDRGFTSLPFPSFCDSQYSEKQPEWVVRGQRVKPSISHRHAAVAAGIATFGWNGLALTDEFGAKNRFMSVISTAELEPTPLKEKELCNKCMLCVKKCPGQAISRDDTVTFRMGERTYAFGAIKKPTCSWYHDGMAVETFGTVPISRTAEPTWAEVEAKRRAVDLLSPAQFGGRITTFTTGGHCGQCLLNCPMGSVWRGMRCRDRTC